MLKTLLFNIIFDAIEKALDYAVNSTETPFDNKLKDATLPVIKEYLHEEEK